MFPTPSVRRWNCLKCGRLFFEAYLPESAYIVIKCAKCGHIGIIKPAEYTAAMNEQAASALTYERKNNKDSESVKCQNQSFANVDTEQKRTEKTAASVAIAHTQSATS